ncbi:MAG: hypothetical protein ACRC37_06965, partial [Lentisphaeria bacterium]
VQFGFLGKVYLIGYSFGSVIVNRMSVFSRRVLIAPPIITHRFLPINSGNLVIIGEKDIFCPNDDLKEIVTNAEVETIAESDHFFIGKENYIADVIIKEVGL